MEEEAQVQQQQQTGNTEATNNEAEQFINTETDQSKPAEEQPTLTLPPPMFGTNGQHERKQDPPPSTFNASNPADVAEAERQQLLPPATLFYDQPGGEEGLVATGDSPSGRCLKATQDIPAKQVVFSDPPLVVVVADKKETKFCNHCFSQMTQPQQCPTCESAYFCTQECFDNHKHTELECPVYKRLRTEFSAVETPIGYACRMMINIVQNFANTQSKEQLEKFYSFMALVSHSAHIDKSPWAHHYRRRCQVVDQIFEQNGAVTPLLQQIAEPYGGMPRMMFEIMCRIHCNAFAVKSVDGNDCGNAIFLKGALLNHSCQANCVLMPTVESLKVVASRPITTGTELTVQYCAANVNNLPRRQFLQQNYFFTCMCDACKAPRF